jgi:transcription-repair coupling factor (superfamily II helicase)
LEFPIVPLDLSIFHKALSTIENEGVTPVTSLSGSSGALLFSMTGGPALLLCSSDVSAFEFYSDSLFWSKLLNITPPVLIPPEGSPDRPKKLKKLYDRKKDTFIASVEASLSPLWERNSFPSFQITKGLISDREKIIGAFSRMGYLTVPMVSREGEMSMRGGILDIFPPDRDQPARIEFFGDEVESLRFFDIETQLSVKEVVDITISPAVEPDEGPNLIELLKNSRLFLNEPDDIKRHHPALTTLISERETTDLTSLPLESDGFKCNISSASGFGLLHAEKRTIADFIERVSRTAAQYNIILACSSEGQAKRLKELFFEQDIDVPVVDSNKFITCKSSPLITIGELSRGFAYQNTIILSARDIFGSRPAFKSTKKSKVSGLISSIEDFKKGDHVVHVDHGIGKFLGIKKERIEGFEDDFLTVEFVGGDKLFIPLYNINYIQKYNAPGNVKPKLDRLGGKTWQRTKQRVKKKIKDMAEKLINIYARRTAAPGYTFSPDTELHSEFDEFFTYEATPDQMTSTNEIKHDMESPLPMDRLLCGDVGYGKTEVVMRACFKAVYDSKQVAVLVPTTILAEQHYETFVSRFSAFPIKIDFLSRFKSRAEQKQTLKALAEGGVDIVIGTHRLLGKDVHFFSLGLLVIDEEHKFGVAHKEKVKALTSNVDVLTLSATPIPRTLHMALSGIRGMSTIETPPEDRLAVKSTVADKRGPSA